MAGGLATTTTIVRSDLWRMGQCRPGTRIQFKRITWRSAQDLCARIECFIDTIRRFSEGHLHESDLRPLDIGLPEGWDETILHEIEGDEASGTTLVKFRQVSLAS
jgi:urea carboxylase